MNTFSLVQYTTKVYTSIWERDFQNDEATKEEMKDYFNEYVFERAFQSLSFTLDNTPEGLLVYMHEHVPVNRILEFVEVCNIAVTLMEDADDPHTSLPSKIAMELFDLTVAYPNLSGNDVIKYTDIILTCAVCQTCSGAHIYSKAVRDKVCEYWCAEDQESWGAIVTAEYALEGLKAVLTVINNENVSDLAKVWVDNHDEVNECMTTWIPQEMMEDVAWLTGKGVVELE